ncbi:MAG: M48 family metallopeptidase [Candidatus Gastranaerophilales bacterium]|nr:M48 family metallopeptidase [Candidatus Gastranaerophilales bacterium]
MNNNYENNYKKLILNNNNVSKTNEVRDLFLFIAVIALIIALIYFGADIIANIYIDNMPDKTQIRIEELISSVSPEREIDKQYKNKVTQLDNLKQKIIIRDTKLKGKSTFPIRVLPSDEINAAVNPGGTIYFTKGILDTDMTEQELMFVLAHEIGHYSNRDHLKGISRQLLVLAITFIFTAGQSHELNIIIDNVSNLNSLSYSRTQERNADLYAGKMLIYIYGTNEGGKIFMKRLQKNEKTPSFLHYFSTHPSWQERLKLLETQK